MHNRGMESTTAHTELATYLLSQGIDQELVEQIVTGLTEEQAQGSLDAFAAGEAEKAALRERLMSDEVLRSVVCPPTTWKTPEARYEVSKVAVAIIENTAATHEVTVEALLNGFKANKDSMAKTIEMFGDPRLDGFAPGQSYYAWRCRVRDALAVAKEDETKAAREAARLARYSKIEGMGLEVCTRCDGNGGFKHWPDFTCYQCGGIGGVEPHDH